MASALTPCSSEASSDEMSTKISKRRVKNFIPLIEDVAEWLTKTFRREITAEDLMSELDTGTIICELAVKIQNTSTEFCSKKGKRRDQTRELMPLPKFEGKIHENAKKESFQARENAANFLR